VAALAGEAAVGRLLVLSQVALSFALPFALAPLVWFTASRTIMGPLTAARATSVVAALLAAGLALLNIKLIADAFAF
jgi:manganese transport protein